MTVRKQKIQVEVEMTTEGAVSSNKKFTDSVEKSRKAVESENKALKRASTAYQIQTARAKNLASKVDAFAKAERRATSAAKRHQETISRQSKAYSGLSAAVRATAGKLRIDAVGALQAVASVGRAAIDTTVELAQESLAASNVFQNLPFSLNAARDSTKGLADDMTLARNAVMAHQSGVATTGKAYGELVGIAQTLALKMGRDVSETVERVTQGIAKQEREILDELVVLPKLNDVLAEFAAANDTSVDKLTAQQRQSAFTESALKALRDATKGVSTDMDGAAGAIARTVVELQNAKIQILGGKEASVSMSQGLKALDRQTLRLATSASEHGVNALLVREALENQGVAMDKVAKGGRELERQVKGLLKVEARRISTLADRNKLTLEELKRADDLIDAGGLINDVNERLIERNRERLGQSKEQLAVQAVVVEQNKELRSDLEASLIGTQDAIALAQARGEEQSEINSLRALELTIQADILEADGELEKAAKARRKAELARIKATAPKRGGGGGGSRVDKEAEERTKRVVAAGQRRLAHFERINTLELNLARVRRDKLAVLDPFSAENVERQLTNVIDLGERRAKIELDQRLRAIDELRAQGVEPIELAELEADAKIRGIRAVAAAKDEAIQREIQLAILTGQEAEVQALRDERRITAAESLNEIEGTLHDLQMTRISERDRAEEASLKRRQELVASSSNLWISAAETIARAVVMEGQSLQKAVAGTAKKLALEHGILAVSEGLKALSSLASFNVIGAAAHATAAAEHAAFAVGMGTIAGVAGGAGGAGGGVAVPGALGAASFGGGPGGAANGPGGSSSSGGGGGSDLGGEVPISPTGEALDASGQAASQAGGASVNVTQHITVSSMGDPNEETMQAIAKANRKAGNRLGRLAVGS